METMEDRPMSENLPEEWVCGSVPCSIRRTGRLLFAHVQLPRSLWGAWSSAQEADAALSLRVSIKCDLVDVPGNNRWLNLHAVNAQIDRNKHGKPLLDDEQVKKLLFRDAEVVADRVQSAAAWLAQDPRHSVKPVLNPTYGPGRVRLLMSKVADDKTRGEIMLRAGETAWNPCASYRPFVGNMRGTTVIRYELTFAGFTATELD